MENKKSSEKAAYNLIKKGIAGRKLAPGTQLIETTIAEKLNISRTPVRGALKKLSDEGFVNVIPNKGAFVIKPTFEEIGEAYEARLELELVIIRRVLNNVMEDDIANLRTFIDREYYAIENRDLKEYININKEFHMELAKISGNKFLYEFTERIIDKINIFLTLYDAFYEIKPENVRSIGEHREIISAIEERNRELVEDLTKKHLKNSIQHVKENKLGYRNLAELF